MSEGAGAAQLLSTVLATQGASEGGSAVGMSERTDASGAVGVEQVAEETAGAVPGWDKPPSARRGLSSQVPCYLPPDYRFGSRFGPCLNSLPAVRVLALQSAILVRGVLHGAMSQACRTPQLNAGGRRFINAARPLANPWCRPGKEAASPYREPHSKSEEAAGRFVFRGQAHLSPQLAAKALGQSSKGRVPGGFLCARAWVTARTGGSEMPASLRPGRGLCRMPPEPGGLVRRGPGSTRPAHLAALPPPAPPRPGCV